MAVTASVGRLKQEAKINQKFSDAFHHCIDILKSKQEYITNHCDDIQSRRSFLVGQEMFEFFKEMREQLILKELTLHQPVTVKQESPNTQSINPVKKCFVYVRPEERHAADMKLGKEKCVDIKIEDDDVGEEETSVQNDEIKEEKRATRRRVQQVVYDSSDSEDRDEDSDYNYDDKDDFNNSDNGNEDLGLDYETLEKTRVKKKQRTNSSVGSLEMDETQAMLSESSNHNDDDDDEDDDDDDNNDDDDDGNNDDDDEDEDDDDNESNNSCNDSSDDSDDDEDDDSMPKSADRKPTPYPVKVKIVKISREHPTWSWRKIRSHTGCTKLRDEGTLRRWQKIVDRGGNYKDKRGLVNEYVYKKMIETKENGNKITQEMLIDWCFEGEKKYVPENHLRHHSRFRTRHSWLPRFKESYKITGSRFDLQLPEENTTNSEKNCDRKNPDEEIGNDDNNKSSRKIKNGKIPSRERYAILPYDEKVEIVNVAMRHPKWSMNEIIKHTNSKYLKRNNQVRRWARNLATGGTYDDRRTVMNYWIYAQCLEYTRNDKMFSTDSLINWATEAENNIIHEILPKMINVKFMKLSSHKLYDSAAWLAEFKKKFNIAGQSPNLYVDEKFVKIHQNNYQFDDEDSPDVVDFGNGIKTLKIDSKLLKKYIKPRQTKKSPYVSFEDRVNAVKLFQENPNWSLETIKKNIKGCENLNYKHILKYWANQIKSGPVKYDKSQAINTWVYNKALEHKNNNGTLSSELFKGWLDEAKKSVMLEYKGEEMFRRADSWLVYFKKYYNITGHWTDLQLGSLTDNENENFDDDSDASSDNKSDQQATVKERKKTKIFSIEEKKRILKMAEENPTWSLAELRRQSGCEILLRTDTLQAWKRHIENNGKRVNGPNKKIIELNDLIFAKCLEHKKNNRIITKKLLEKWGLEANKRVNIESFRAGQKWFNGFRRKYNITGPTTMLTIKNIE